MFSWQRRHQRRALDVTINATGGADFDTPGANSSSRAARAPVWVRAVRWCFWPARQFHFQHGPQALVEQMRVTSQGVGIGATNRWRL